MEMERIVEFPHTYMDRPPRKRARLGWDIAEVPKDCFVDKRLRIFQALLLQNIPLVLCLRELLEMVLECWDRERKEMVAIKIVRGIKKYREAAMVEIEVLQQLGKHDKGSNRCVQIRNWFDYRNHICIVSI
ncbi:Serine/threonine-protein kinase AFC2 [Glycine max]|nr:Serine/threonine-protein kinase AFC2 [Glycine max]